jgi:prevent-host-death family protein
MKTATIREAPHHLSKLLEEVEKGHEVILTKRGNQVGKLIPMEKPENPLDRKIDGAAWAKEHLEWLNSGPVLELNPVLAERESYER